MIPNFIPTTKHDFNLFYDKIRLPKARAPSDERVMNAAFRTFGTFLMLFGAINSIRIITNPSLSLGKLILNVVFVVAGRDLFYGYSNIDGLLKLFNAANSPSTSTLSSVLTHVLDNSDESPFRGMILRPVYEAIASLLKVN